MVSFPVLPRFDSPQPEEELDEEERRQRYHVLRSGFKLTEVLNDPANEQMDEEEEELVIDPIPALDDPRLMQSIRHYVTAMGALTQTFQASRHNHMGPRCFSLPANLASDHGQALRARERALLELEREAQRELLACFRLVPAMYFKESFKLSDPAVFNGLCNRPDAMLLQTKLSDFLDRVEVNLLKQISARSHSFFKALHTFQDLHDRVEAAGRQIVSIRQHIAALDERLVLGLLRVLRLRRRRKNLQRLHATLNDMVSLFEAREHIQTLLESNEFIAALELVEETRAVLKSRLQSLHCLRFLERKLVEKARCIVELLAAQFASIALAGGSSDLAAPEAKEENAQNSVNSPHEQKQLTRIAHFMSERDTLRHALTRFREDVLTMLEDNTRGTFLAVHVGASAAAHVAASAAPSDPPPPLQRAQTLAVVETASSEAKSSVVRSASSVAAASPPPPPNYAAMALEQLLDAAQTLSHSQFTGALRLLSAALDTVTRRVAAVVTVVTPVVDHAQQQAWHDLLTDVLGEAAALVSRVLHSRVDVHVQLELSQFCQVLQLGQAVIANTEEQGGGPTSLHRLRTELLLQTKAFLEHFHRVSMQNLASGLEKERWRRVLVARKHQLLLDRAFQTEEPAEKQEVADESVESMLEALKKRQMWEESDEEEESDAEPTEPEVAEPRVPERRPSDAKHARVLFVVHDSQATARGRFSKFHVVPSLLQLLTLISEYVSLSRALPVVASSVVHKLAELLQLFNSRSCQLLLGAGAMHMAGLRSINAKHLALSSQCLGLIISQLPVIRGALARALSSKQLVLLNVLDRVHADFVEHRKEIFAKLVLIVRSLLEGACKKVLRADWAVGRVEDTMPEAHPAVNSVLKQILSLHRVLTELLPVEQRDSILAEIASSCSALFCKHLSTVAPSCLTARRALSVNVEALQMRLRALDGLDETTCRELDVFLFHE